MVKEISEFINDIKKSFKSKKEKLNFLEGINKYVMELEQKYSKA